jgi:type VI protein secretion system component Hcp
MTFRIQKKWRWLVALGAVFVPGIVSGALTLPFTFTAGKPIRASEVNANFEALRSQLDALSGTAARPTVGTLTIAGVVTAVPIRKFAQSVTVPFVAGGASGKPSLSDVQVVFDSGSGTPQLNLALDENKQLTSADIALGNFSLHLTGVVVDHVTVSAPQADLAQQTVSLSYAAVDWSWQVGTGPKKIVSFNRQSNTGGSRAVTSFAYGYFAAGVPADAAYFPITGYTHDVACAGGSAKCVQGPLTVQKTFGSETLDELGVATAGATALSADLEWFSAAGVASNSLQIGNAVVVDVELSTKDDGTFSESVGFDYGQITWKASAGASVASWDVAKNAPF